LCDECTRTIEPVRALTAGGIIVAGFSSVLLLGSWVYKAFPVLKYGPPPSVDFVLPVLCAGLFLMLCLTQWFAWSNFRRFGLPMRQIIVQLLTIFLAVGLIALIIIFEPFLVRGVL
jgi:hypothetical protein